MEVEPMEEHIGRAITELTRKITSDVKADEALKFTQAALNLAHVLAVKQSIDLKKN